VPGAGQVAAGAPHRGGHMAGDAPGPARHHAGGNADMLREARRACVVAQDATAAAAMHRLCEQLHPGLTARPPPP
ncbi:unnamed protein product, partial [Prorocentrum cordatum]